MTTERMAWIGPGEIMERRPWVGPEREELPMPGDFQSPLLRLLAHRLRRRHQRRTTLRRPAPLSARVAA